MHAGIFLVYSFACKNHDFDWPFEILIGHLEKMIGPRNLNNLKP